jgi:hypothetical protein
LKQNNPFLGLSCPSNEIAFTIAKRQKKLLLKE